MKCGTMGVLGLLAAAAAAAGCNCGGWSGVVSGGGESSAGAEVPSALEGRWKAAGTQDEAHAWYKDITLEGDRYEMSGYPPISESATVGEVEEVGPRTWRLTLTEHVFEGEEMEDKVIELELAEDGESFEMRGETYRKQGE